MATEWKRRVTIVMAFLIVVAAARVGIILYRRHQPIGTEQPQATKPSYRITTDDYVALPKIHAYDTKSAVAELAGKTVWVRSGYQVSYYPVSGSGRKVHFQRPAGVLAPLQQLVVKDVVLRHTERPGDPPQLMAVFERSGSPGEYAAPIGSVQGGNYRFFVSDVFFLADPHGLYNHWPPEVWNAIDRHEVKPGMNELQASLALGSSVKIRSSDIGNRTVVYSNGGKPVTVTFDNNRAVKIVSGAE